MKTIILHRRTVRSSLCRGCGSVFADWLRSKPSRRRVLAPRQQSSLRPPVALLVWLVHSALRKLSVASNGVSLAVD